MESGNWESWTEGTGNVDAREIAGGASKTAEREGDWATDAGAESSDIECAERAESQMRYGTVF
jgi:hypothetical protein